MAGKKRPLKRKAAGGEDGHEDDGENNAGEPFEAEQAGAGDGAGQDHAQGAVLGFLADEVATDECDIERQHGIGEHDRHGGGDGEHGEILFAGAEAALTEGAQEGLVGGGGIAQEADDEELRQQQHDETDVGALFGEEFPEFAF